MTGIPLFVRGCKKAPHMILCKKISTALVFGRYCEMNVNRSKSRFKLEHWKKIAVGIALYDIVAVNAAYFFALLLRFDFLYSSIAQRYITTWERFAPIYALMCLVVFMLMGLYKSIWRFAGLNEVYRILAVSFTLGTILPTTGPGLSALIRCIL